MTTDSKHGLPGAANFLARTVTPAAPNQVWTSEMTSLWTDEGWLLKDYGRLCSLRRKGTFWDNAPTES